MKELIYSRVEIVLMLISSMLAFIAAQVSFTNNQIRTITPFYMDVKSDYSGESEQDNNLTGNSGISQDYYTKQVRQFLSNKDSSD